MLRRTLLISALSLPFGGGASTSPALLQPAPGAPFRLLLGGDTSFGENYQFDHDGRTTTPVAAFSYGHSLERLRPLMARAEYTVLNLETPLTDDREPVLQGKAYLHWSDVERAPEQLRAHGVDAVGLANNHTLDFGQAGLRNTFETLRRHDIQWFGAGENADSAARPLIIPASVNGPARPIAVFGMFEYRRRYDQQYRFYATDRQAGANRLDVATFARGAEDFRRLYPSLFVIAFPHWGANYQWRSDEQAALARGLLDAGADMVIGHHGHVLQEIERYRGRWILYGVGNFMFNSPGRFSRYRNVLPFSLAVDLLFPNNGGAPEVRLYPIQSDNRVTDFQPRLASAGEFRRVFDALAARADAATRARMSASQDGVGRFIQLRSD